VHGDLFVPNNVIIGVMSELTHEIKVVTFCFPYKVTVVTFDSLCRKLFKYILRRRWIGPGEVEAGRD
jgi:hypothetical protein